MVINSDKYMKAEQVIINKTPKSEVIPWNPDVEKLPAIVREQLDKWLSPEATVRRRRVTHKALRDMVRDGEAQERTVILQLQGTSAGDIIEKPFTFYKLKREKQISNP
jgi:hypothetical protein